jgi:hypothetical protein
MKADESDVEARIYYESIEQAQHFLRPCMEAALDRVGLPATPIKLVKLKKPDPDTVVAASIRSALARKDQDAVITLVRGGVESVLAFMEFSTAVHTKDHCEQRFDSFVSASYAEAPFVKVYARRVSPSRHGGGAWYDDRPLYASTQQTLGIPAFDYSWPTTADKLYAITDPRFLSCPEPEERMIALLESLAARSLSITEPLGPAVLTNRTGLPEWAQEELAKNDMDLEPYEPEAGSTREWRDNDGLHLKFNRWDHAMDPERGMSFVRRVYDDALLIGHIHDKTASSSLDGFKAFCRAISLDAAAFSEDEISSGVVDISRLLPGANPGRVGRALLTNCREFRVCDAAGKKLVVVNWERASVPSAPEYGSPGAKTALAINQTITEDEVTYCVVHDLLLPNGYTLVAASYPGAQGDHPVLGEPNGRKTRRTYIDVIAFHPERGELIIIESKGPFQRPKAVSDAKKALEFRDQPSDSERLRRMAGRFCPGAEDASTKIIVGIAYARGEVDGRVFDDDETSIDAEICVASAGWRGRFRGDQIFPESGSVSVPERYEY